MKVTPEKNEKVGKMIFGSIYPLYLNRLEKMEEPSKNSTKSSNGLRALMNKTYSNSSKKMSPLLASLKKRPSTPTLTLLLV